MATMLRKIQTIAEVDSDKATLELPAEEAGIITLKAEEGDTVAVGDVVCIIDTDAPKPEGIAEVKEEKKEEVVAEPAKAAAPVASETPVANGFAKGHPSPVAKKMMAEHDISPNQVEGTGRGGRITKQDVLAAMAGGISASSAQGWGGTRESSPQKMSMLRRKIAQRLVAVKNETAMLTTFNEIDMKPVMDLRAKYKEAFKEKHEVGLGFMSFFTKAMHRSIEPIPSCKLND